MTGIAVLVLAAGLIAVLTIHVIYRRQIQDICRQISFLETEETNKLVTTHLSAKEVVRLTEGINSLNTEAKRKVRDCRIKEERLKEAISNISHDIRTPLTSMDGYFQLLKESGKEEEQERYLDIIQGRIENLTMLLEELFMYTRLQNEGYVLEMERENITQLVLDAVFSFYGEFKKAAIVPEISFEEEPVYVRCSKAAVSRIVCNLVKNALAHGEKYLKITWERQGDRQVFSCANRVKDPESIDVEQVFDRFYKADHARTGTAYAGKAPSTGLGLAIAKELAEKMNGEINAVLSGEEFTVSVSFPQAHLRYAEV